MRRLVAFLYWFTCGALIGLGLAIIYSIGLLLVVLEVVFLVYEVRKVGDKGLWVAVVGLGGAPASLLLIRYLISKPCPSGQNGLAITVGPGEAAGCSHFPEGYLYYIAIFGVIALIGLGWGLVQKRVKPSATDK